MYVYIYVYIYIYEYMFIYIYKLGPCCRPQAYSHRSISLEILKAPSSSTFGRWIIVDIRIDGWRVQFPWRLGQPGPRWERAPQSHPQKKASPFSMMDHLQKSLDHPGDLGLCWVIMHGIIPNAVSGRVTELDFLQERNLGNTCVEGRMIWIPFHELSTRRQSHNHTHTSTWAYRNTYVHTHTCVCVCARAYGIKCNEMQIHTTHCKTIKHHIYIYMTSLLCAWI